MFVREVSGPDDSSSATLHDPTWATIEGAILGLDGEKKTMVVLGTGDDGDVPHMAVAGGKAGRYVVYVTYDNAEFHSLLDPTAPDGQVSLVAGGQRGDFSLMKCVDLKTALRAAATFSATGALDDALHWSTE
jgi:hypothetical protein